MRQRRWLEFIKDYDFDIQYHEGKANVVADALSRKTSHTLSTMVVADQLCLDFQKMNLEVMQYGEVEKIFSVSTIQPSMFDQIREAQLKDEKIKEKVREGHAGDFEIHENGSLRMEGRWCIPEACEDLKFKIMEEGHNSPYSMHPGGYKLYKDLKKNFWWARNCRSVDQVCSVHTYEGNMVDGPLAKAYIKHVLRLHGVPKDTVSDRDSRFLSTFWQKLQQAFGSKLLMSTAFHPATDGQTESTIQTLEDMLRACVMEYQGSWEDHLDLIEFSYNNSYHSSIGMTPFEALYGRKCRSPLCWNDISETVVLGPELIEETVQQVKMIQGKIKAAQDRQKSYADLKRREEEYELRRYIPDKSHVLQPETVQIDKNLSYEERPIKIFDIKVRATRNKDVKIVKVLWSNQKFEEAIWEAEAEMRKKYPELFAEG
ncbi:uncharacterized protein LOC130591822 [Beta vulgaris subsp. vulgaris]|uniref:uncharacterized protein LOC130591822 n=1 Tax=Beta vulgaris subsp. vulgaris TaxID=3555 RepID=UPI002547E703|nr:uncharacterized protein LOC130591822 [Beta vulgaris subsp. vulgaris]